MLRCALSLQQNHTERDSGCGTHNFLIVPNFRIAKNADMVFERCFVPDSARLPGVDSFKDTNKVLAISR